jgi:hypothetical protein
MSIIINKNELNELVGGDIYSDGGDRNAVSNSEIETGPVDKPFNDDSDYQKGQSTTTDKVFALYRQDIPWFANYNFGSSNGALPMNRITERNKRTVKKEQVEEIIEDLVKKKKIDDVTDKNYNPKIAKIIDTINDSDLTDAQIEELSKLINTKKTSVSKNI